MSHGSRHSAPGQRSPLAFEPLHLSCSDCLGTELWGAASHGRLARGDGHTLGADHHL